MQNDLCFQPQYVGRFVCDGSKCDARCCRQAWSIDTDKATYEKYLHVKPESAARAITELFRYDADSDSYVVAATPCPLLTSEKLCRLQRDYGEDFLSPTCRTYPRVICNFGEFFERSMTLTCPVAAEMILFENEPMTFEFIEENFSAGKFQINRMRVDEKLVAHVIDIQAAMISILQERTLTIDQRLIVLGFFLDRLDELATAFNEPALMKLLAVYESEKFLAEQVPMMIQSVCFDEKKFSATMSAVFAQIPDEKISVAMNDFINVRKKFQAAHAIFLENFLVNEIFQTCCPWRFEGSIANNFKLFAAKYKIFELMLLSAANNGVVSKDELIRSVGHFTQKINHGADYQRRIFLLLAKSGDVLDLMNSLLDGGD